MEIEIKMSKNLKAYKGKTKTCKKCGLDKPVTDFPTDNSSKDKLWRFCRACESDRKKTARMKKQLAKKTTKKKPSKKGRPNDPKPVKPIKVRKANFDDETFIASFNRDEPAIKLRLDNLQYGKDRICPDDPLEVFMARVFNHEYLHWILYHDHGDLVEDPCADLDNLTHSKQQDPKIRDYWLS